MNEDGQREDGTASGDLTASGDPITRGDSAASGDPMARGDSAASESPGVLSLKRWESSGAIWRVLHRARDRVTVSMLTCTGEEEMDRLDTDDPEVLAYIGDRTSSEEPA